MWFAAVVKLMKVDKSYEVMHGKVLYTRERGIVVHAGQDNMSPRGQVKIKGYGIRARGCRLFYSSHRMKETACSAVN